MTKKPLVQGGLEGRAAVAATPGRGDMRGERQQQPLQAEESNMSASL